MTQAWDRLFIDANLATMEDSAYGARKNAALAVKDGRIAWIGSRQELPASPESLAAQVVSLKDQWITPGLIDCHTHLIFGGNRANEFEQRLQGVSYEEIARKGGGINASVTQTRAASEETLYALTAKRLQRFLKEGVTTIEMKSGYGLDLETEMRMLRVARKLGETFPVDVKTTFLGAHALPPEYRSDRAGYVKLVIETMLPAVKERGLADAVDAFCENIGFCAEETDRIFAKAVALDLPVKLHADQLTDGGGAALAARYGALSADHLEYTNEEGIRAMAGSGSVAVLLPGAFYILREKQVPPLELFHKHGVSIAIASDSNPGSAPVLSLQAMLNMACTLFRMTPQQALLGVTRNAAQALGIGDEVGTLTVGKKADLAVWDIETPAELSYWLGGNPLTLTVKDGVTV